MANIDITELFCADPERFMHDNLVMQWIQHDKAEILNIGVKQIEEATIDNKPRGKVCFFYNKGDSPSLPAYWCPYAQNKLMSAMLGNKALFAFTAAVTGCSVGIGSGLNGSQMMCHVNSAQIGVDWKETGQAAQRQEQSQNAQLNYKLGSDSTISSPTNYRANSQENKATIFAVHGLNLSWELHTLSYRQLGKFKYYHAGVARSQ